MMTRIHLTSVANLAVALAVPAMAQQAPLAADAAAQAADTGDEVGEIVVTAQKRSQSAQRVPVSLTAVTGADLANQGVKDLFQAVTLVPGVVFSRAPDDGLALTFRGLGTQARPQAFEQSVALLFSSARAGFTPRPSSTPTAWSSSRARNRRCSARMPAWARSAS